MDVDRTDSNGSLRQSGAIFGPRCMTKVAQLRDGSHDPPKLKNLLQTADGVRRPAANRPVGTYRTAVASLRQCLSRHGARVPRLDGQAVQTQYRTFAGGQHLALAGKK